MRVPKFRAWLEEDKRLLSVETIAFRGDSIQVTFEPNPNCSIMTQCIELMESTGLKDKNGKEIYEEDIVKYSVTDGFNYVIDKIGAVVYNKGAFYVDDFFIGDIDTSDIEVIGNILEDRELLDN